MTKLTVTQFVRLHLPNFLGREEELVGFALEQKAAHSRRAVRAVITKEKNAKISPNREYQARVVRELLGEDRLRGRKIL